MSHLLHAYAEILTDPAHTLVELTFTVVVDGLLLGVAWPAVRRAIRKEHTIIDQEHGKEHK